MVSCGTKELPLALFYRGEPGSFRFVGFLTKGEPQDKALQYTEGDRCGREAGWVILCRKCAVEGGLIW